MVSVCFVYFNMTVLLFVYIAYLKASQNKLHCDAAADNNNDNNCRMVQNKRWITFLNFRKNRNDWDDQAHDKIEADEKLVQMTTTWLKSKLRNNVKLRL